MHSACWRPSFDRSAARPQLRLTTLSATALTHVRFRCTGTRTAARQCRTSIRRAWSHDDRAIPCKRRRFVSPAPGRARSASCSLDACHVWWQHPSQRSHHTGSCLHLESRWLPLTTAQLQQTNAIDPAWEATIATDRAQQHTLPQQRPFSDSYAQGKPPAKRQKVIHEDSTPSQVFSSLFRQAVDNSNALPDGTSFSGTCLLARWYLSTLRALLSVNPRWRRLSSCHEIGRGGQGDCTGRAVPPPGSERSAQLGGQQSRLPAGTLPAHATTHSRRGTHHLDDRHEHEHEHEHEQHGIERMMSERHLQRTVTI